MSDKSLMSGSSMHCPRCLRLQSVVAYRPLKMAPHFANELNPVIKCPSCGWLFSPGLDVDQLKQIVAQWIADLSPAEAGEQTRALLEAVA